MTQRKGSKNLYYKRRIPKALQTPDRGKQIWRSLGTDDEQIAKVAYRKIDERIDEQFAEWESGDLQAPNVQPLAQPQLATLTSGLLRRLVDEHYLNVYELDFEWRGELWRTTRENEAAFWQGSIVTLPKDDWVASGDPSKSYFAWLMEEPVLEEIFVYSIFRMRQSKLRELRRTYQLGDRSGHYVVAEKLLAPKSLVLSPTDRARLERKLMEAETRALEDITAGDERTFELVIDRQVDREPQTQSVAPTAAPAPALSDMIEKYLDETARERENGRRRPFCANAGNWASSSRSLATNPLTRTHERMAHCSRIRSLHLPAQRNVSRYKGLDLTEIARKTSQLAAAGSRIDLLNPITINDKIGTISVFFAWLQSRNASVINPLAGQGMRRRGKNRKGKKRYPWTVDELNRLFASPIYTGCQSERYWHRPGSLVLRNSAKFWLPLIAIFSGMRLGEIIQLGVSDLKTTGEIHYFDVTPLPYDRGEEEVDDLGEDEKSLKTSTSHRAIPVHQALIDIGLLELLALRRASGDVRLFPDYEKAQDDDSWSKQFSKHFTRFRKTIGVTRRGVKFHSLRHNMEDALRNADVRMDVRDAIQGHSESGVSREYGSGYYVKTLNAAVQQISYEGLKIDHLKLSQDGPPVWGTGGREFKSPRSDQ